MRERFLVQNVVLKRLKYASTCECRRVRASVCTSLRVCVCACVLRYAPPPFENVRHQRQIHAAKPENVSMKHVHTHVHKDVDAHVWMHI